MEQIIKSGEQYYYGERKCRDADDAYCRFRDEYHAGIGRVAFKRLTRLGSRTERVHGYGFVFEEDPVDPKLHFTVVPTRLMGIIAGAYCRMLGGWDIPWTVDDDNYEQWFDWAFSYGSRAIKLARTKDKSGRTGDKKKRYR